MPKIVNIQYNPALSVKENAKKNHVSETSIRNYIQKHELDRRYDRKQNLIADCKKYLKKHPNASRNELQRETGHSLSTIRKYWKYISTEETLIDFNKEKVKKYHIQQEEAKEKQFAYLDTIPKEVILEYLAKRDEREQSKENEKKKVEEVTILDGIPFNPFEEFHIPVADCIQFHSKALPEYRVLSNHYNCIITFRGVEFYAVEQLYWALCFSDSPAILKKIMNCTSGTKAKSLCEHNYLDKLDWNYDEKQWRVIALCHLYKYLSVKEYRDRLRETYPQTLVECPNGNDDEYGLVQNLETNIFEGHNCSGRTSMIVRDKMLALENEIINKRQQELGRELTVEEQDAAFQELYDSIRFKFDNDKQVIKDSKPLFAVLEKEGISKVRDKHPKPITVPIIDRNTKCLVLDFDDTLFDTSADDEYRKGRKKDMDKAKSMIPQYHLLEGWREVIDWTQNNGVEIAILSSASGDLIGKALNHFNIPCAAIIGFQPYIEKPNTILGNMLQSKLNIRHEQIIYVGNSKADEVQSRASQFKFIGTTWLNSDVDYFKEKGVPTVDNPKELISIMEDAGWTNSAPKVPAPIIHEEKRGDIIEIRYKDRVNLRSSKYYGLVRCSKDFAYFFQGVPLSNWWDSPSINYDGHSFKSSESLYMYLKALKFGDTETAEKISKTSYRGAKRLGRTVKGFDENEWRNACEDAMYTALEQKLKYDSVFKEALLSDTYKGKTFVEASKFDSKWGIGVEASDAVLKKGVTAWKGDNLLGKTLTRLRDAVLGTTTVLPVAEPLILKKKRVLKSNSPKEDGIVQEFPLEGKMYHSVLGAIIGDIAGSVREGYDNNTNKTNLDLFTSASSFTDDSVLTIALADWLNHKDTMPIADALKYWGNRFPNAGYGSNFMLFLKPKKNKTFNDHSTSNGAAMRVSPVALKAKSLDEALSLAEESAAPSHTGGGIKGAQAIAAATYIAKDGVALGKSADEIKADIRSFVVERFNLNLNRSIEDIRALIMPLAAEDRENSKKKGIDKPTFEEWKTCDALLSSEMALTAVMYSTTYEEALRLAISMGGDSDTIAAMAGSVAAQLYGIPEALIKKALVFLPSEMIDVINEFEGSDFQPTGIKPPKVSRWRGEDIIVYGQDEKGEKNEDGNWEVFGKSNYHKKQGYPIPTIGKSLDEIQEGVKKFIEVAKANPDNRYIVHKVGYHKTDYTLQQIAPFFKEAVGMKNILLPEPMFNELTKQDE